MRIRIRAVYCKCVVANCEILTSVLHVLHKMCRSELLHQDSCPVKSQLNILKTARDQRSQTARQLFATCSSVLFRRVYVSTSTILCPSVLRRVVTYTLHYTFRVSHSESYGASIPYYEREIRKPILTLWPWKPVYLFQ